MKFLKTLCALALMSSTAGLMALKVTADSPIGICTNRGLTQGTPKFNQCVQEQERIQQQGQNTNSMNYNPNSITVKPLNQYGPHTGIVPPNFQQ